MGDVRVAIVTGGTRGLGRAIAGRLAAAGFVPALVYRQDVEAARAVKESLPEAIVEQVDVASPEAVAAFVDRVLATHGRIDALVHAAFRSGRAPKKLHEVAIDGWTEDLATNLTGAFLITRACLPAMLAAKYGRIVYIGSLAARGERGRAAYSVAKQGLAGLARTVAQEYAADGITANVVSPGYIEAGAFLRLDPAIRERARSRVPMGRLGTAEEVAEAVAYFCSPASGFTTGQILGVDGGAL